MVKKKKIVNHIFGPSNLAQLYTYVQIRCTVISVSYTYLYQIKKEYSILYTACSCISASYSTDA